MDDLSTIALIEQALSEDIGHGDLTSTLFIAEDALTTCHIVARQPARLCGVEVAIQVFNVMDISLMTQLHKTDGQDVAAGETVLTVEGPARQILAAERTALNFLSYLSGIATHTAECVKAVEGTGVTILDTRKTLPGYRTLAKYAVRCGGGRNHRMRLDDGVMLKDNHIAIAGGIAEAISRAKHGVPALTKIEIECDTLEQVSEALKAGADVIMLDNMSVEDVREAVRLVDKRVPLEVSGGMTRDTLRPYAETGIDFISLGALTHSVTAIDFALDYKN